MNNVKVVKVSHTSHDLRELSSQSAREVMVGDGDLPVANGSLPDSISRIAPHFRWASILRGRRKKAGPRTPKLPTKVKCWDGINVSNR